MSLVHHTLLLLVHTTYFILHAGIDEKYLGLLDLASQSCAYCDKQILSLHWNNFGMSYKGAWIVLRFVFQI